MNFANGTVHARPDGVKNVLVQSAAWEVREADPRPRRKVEAQELDALGVAEPAR